MNKINEFVKTFQLELDSKRKQEAHRRRFSVALKQAVVALMQEQVVDRKQMAALIGVSDWTINDWINKPLFNPATHTHLRLYWPSSNQYTFKKKRFLRQLD